MAIVSTQRIADKRKLPIEKVSKYATELAVAVWQEEEALEEVSKILHDWLDEIGFDRDSGMVFDFGLKKKYLNADISVECAFDYAVVRYSLGSIEAPAVRKGEDIDEAVLDCGVGILASFDSVIFLILRKMTMELFFNKRDPDFKYQDALYLLGVKTI